MTSVRPLVAELAVPGDKSVTHRALLLGAVAEGRTTVRNALASADTLATAAVVRRLGATVSWQALDASGATRGDDRTRGGDRARGGDGTRGGDPARDDDAAPHDVLALDGVAAPLSATAPPLDCANSGTAARLLAGLLAGRQGEWVLDGDASLRARPMERVAEPLRRLGARIDGGRLPLTVHGAPLSGGEVVVDVPSAQVKSALLLAGLVADAPLTVVQHVPTRDHTERMMPLFGVQVEREPGRVRVHPGRPRAAALDVPGDPSSAAFLLVAALLLPGSELWVRGVGLWPRRTGFLRALLAAGGDVAVLARRGTGQVAGDPVGDLRAGGSALTAFEIAPDDVPDLVDEVPILALAAACAEGESRFHGLSELRVKESDRLAALAGLLADCGAGVRVDGEALAIAGVGTHRNGAPRLRPPPPAWCAHADHRIAMTAAIATLAAGAGLPQAVPSAAVSFPGFLGMLRRAQASTG